MLSRREFLKITAAAGAAMVGGGYLHRRARQPAVWQAGRVMMGTQVALTVASDDEFRGQTAISATFAEMARLIAIFDHRQPESALARLNACGRVAGAPAELLDLIVLAKRYGEISDGAYDITVKPVFDACRRGEIDVAPYLDRVGYQGIEVGDGCVELLRPGMALTLDSIAKGRVVDGAVALLRAMGFEHILVEAGGDLYGQQGRPGGRPWRVGLARPRAAHPRAGQPATLLATFPIYGQAVATSGDYQQAFATDYSHHHILDPRTGWSPAELSSVTVIAPSTADADALSTAVMVLGVSRGMDLVERLDRVEALLVTKEMAVSASSGFPQVELL
jgi:FAD:protein FMN transferase